MEASTFPAKILLFGEYTVINGGAALAVPFWKYSGQWKNDEDGKSLLSFYDHLETLDEADIEKIVNARANHLTYHSNIPQGYGLGSSGSLSAAAFSDLFVQKERTIETTRTILAEIESFFHGNSSGMDPLTCFYQKPVYIKEGQITLLDELNLPSQLKLLDSKKTRFSKPLIEHFKIRVDADPDYESDIAALSKFNSRVIEETITGRDIASTFKEISSLQYDLFIRMIPIKLRELWQEGLATDKYYLKLSGAGGGGYYLVYEKEEGSLEGLIGIED